MKLSFNSQFLNEKIESITSCIKSEPLNATHRVAMANIRLLQRQYPKALQQLQVACQLDQSWAPQAQLTKMLIQSETLRHAVFSGQIQADLFEPPSEWLECMMQALKRSDEAAQLREKGLEEAPETPGKLNESQDFSWFSDGDERLGPTLEIYASSSYFWLPVERVISVELQPQENILDLLWMKASVTMSGDKRQKISCFIPARYPESDNEAEKTSYETEWMQGITSNGWQGKGARIWYYDGAEVSMQNVSKITFNI